MLDVAMSDVAMSDVGFVNFAMFHYCMMDVRFLMLDVGYRCWIFNVGC